MDVVVVGTGYVGLVSGTCFAELGHSVTCVDTDQSKIDQLVQGRSPLYEPGLSDLLERNIRQNRLHFSTSYDSVRKASIIFLAVGTPSLDSGEANLSYLQAAAKTVAENLCEGAIVVIKSTVPIGTSQQVRELMTSHTDKTFHVISNPEFLKEGAAVSDFMKPDRVVIGHANEKAATLVKKLYDPIVLQGNPIYLMSNESAEMTKYASNCFLATKISFINEIARLCEVTGADISEVREGVKSDKRIGGQFLYPGVGYGGSCFPKDVSAMIYCAKEKDMNVSIVEAAHAVNQIQRQWFFDKITGQFNDDLKGKTLAMWGVSFKPNTDDVREAPSLTIAREIVKAGGSVHFFDPLASDNFLKQLGPESEHIQKFDNKYDCLNNADALILMTEWNLFRDPDLSEIKSRLINPIIFDGRNIYNSALLKENGIVYHGIGKG